MKKYIYSIIIFTAILMWSYIIYIKIVSIPYEKINLIHTQSIADSKVELTIPIRKSKIPWNDNYSSGLIVAKEIGGFKAYLSVDNDDVYLRLVRNVDILTVKHFGYRITDEKIAKR